MEPKSKSSDSNRFSIIFEKLEEAKKQQESNFEFDLKASSEIEETLSLFKEYEESLHDSGTGFVITS